MKKIFILLFIIFSFISYSQEKKVSKSGHITFNSNSILEYKNLTIENEIVTYNNVISNEEMKFPLSSIKKILDEKGLVLFQSKSNVNLVNPKTAGVLNDNISSKYYKSKEEQLQYKNASTILMNNKVIENEILQKLLSTDPVIYENYSTGKGFNTLGNIMIGGGIGLFIGGGLVNLSKANSNSSERGSSTPLIVGIITSVIGIPIKLSGVSQIKQSISDYNSSPKKTVSFIDRSELKVLASSNGLGVQLKF